MSKLSKLIGMASKALDKGGSSQPSPNGSGGSGDWRSMVRSAADALTGDGRGTDAARPADPYAPAPAAPRPAASGYAPPPAAGSAQAPAASAGDRAAIARYDYLVQTADPAQLEQIHREAFARLTPEQRAQVEARMRAELPPHEQPRTAEAADLARSATRSEAMRPGSMRGLLARVGGRAGGGRGGAGRAVGGMALGAAGGVLAAVAGGAVVSAVAGPLLDQAAGIDFDAIGANLDLEGIAGGVEGFADGAMGDLGEQVSGFGEQLGGFELPGLGDFFGR